jgi:hypothetical protein
MKPMRDLKPVRDVKIEVVDYAKHEKNREVQKASREMLDHYFGYQVGSKIITLQTCFIFIISLVAMIGGLYLAGTSGDSEFDLLGLKLQTSNVGIAFGFLGVAGLVLGFHNINKAKWLAELPSKPDRS